MAIEMDLKTFDVSPQSGESVVAFLAADRHLRQCNRFLWAIQRDSFPASDEVFGRVEVVQVIGSKESVIGTGDIGGGMELAPYGRVHPVSSFGVTLGWGYDENDELLLPKIRGDILVRVISLNGQRIRRRMSLALGFVEHQPPPPHHSVGIVASSGHIEWSNASGSFSLSATATGSNRAVYFRTTNVRNSAGNQFLASASYDGASMGAALSSQGCPTDGASNIACAQVWRKLAPNTTAGASASVTLVGGANFGGFSLLLLNGVHQTTPEGTIVKGSGTGNTIGAGSVTLPTNGLIFDCAYFNSSSTITATPSHTQDDLRFISGQYYDIGCQHTQNTGAQSLTWGISASGGHDNWAQIIVPVQEQPAFTSVTWTPTLAVKFGPSAPWSSFAPHADWTAHIGIKFGAASPYQANVSASGTITLTDIATRRVFQRNASGIGSIPVAGTSTGSNGEVQARVVLHGTSTEIVPWTHVTVSVSGVFSGTLAVPEGAWYDLQVRKAASSIHSNGANQWGVGEVGYVFGQSNGDIMFKDFSSVSSGTDYTSSNFVSQYDIYNTAAGWNVPTRNGAVNLGNTLVAGIGVSAITGQQVPIGLVNTAKGGIGVSGGTTDWWLKLDGTVWPQWQAAMDATAPVAWGLHIAGEGDGLSSNYLGDCETLYSRMRTYLSDPTLDIFIQMLGTYNAGTTDAAGNALRKAQQALGLEPYNHIGATTHPNPTQDGVHYTPASFAKAARENAYEILKIMGLRSYGRGPYILGFSAMSSTVTRIHLIHRGGTDIVPTSGITGFRVQGVAPSSAVRSSSTTIDLTHTAISGARSVDYLYGWKTVPNAATVVSDNTPETLFLEELVPIFPVYPVGLASEIDTALPLSTASQVVVGQPLEHDFSQQVVRHVNLVSVFQAGEMDSAQHVTVVGGGIISGLLTLTRSEPFSGRPASEIAVYQKAETARFFATFRDGNGALAEPISIKFDFLKSDGTQTTYTYPGSAAMTRESLGKFYVDVILDLPGDWRYRWTAIGASVLIENWQFVVLPDSFQ